MTSRDPPLILKVIPQNRNHTSSPDEPSSISDQDLLNLQSKIICVANLTTDESEDISCIIKFDNHADCAIFGERCQRGVIVQDIKPASTLSMFYAFSDLAIRLPGIYKIKITVLDITAQEVLHTIDTSPFEVYTPKMFPGMLSKRLKVMIASTLLTNHLCNLGVPNLKKRGFRENQDHRGG